MNQFKTASNAYSWAFPAYSCKNRKRDWKNIWNLLQMFKNLTYREDGNSTRIISGSFFPGNRCKEFVLFWNSQKDYYWFSFELVTLEWIQWYYFTTLVIYCKEYVEKIIGLSKSLGCSCIRGYWWYHKSLQGMVVSVVFPNEIRGILFTVCCGPLHSVEQCIDPILKKKKKKSAVAWCHFQDVLALYTWFYCSIISGLV